MKKKKKMMMIFQEFTMMYSVQKQSDQNHQTRLIFKPGGAADTANHRWGVTREPKIGIKKENIRHFTKNFKKKEGPLT